MYDPNEFETLLLLGCLGNALPHGQKAYTKYQTDAWMRRGLLMQQRGSARWIGLMLYAEQTIANFGDFDRAELYLWEAVRESYSKEVWAVLSLAHYYQYTRCDPRKAKRLLLWGAKSRAEAAKIKVKADPANVLHNRQYDSGGIGLEDSMDSGFGVAYRDQWNNPDTAIEADKEKREGENYFKMKMMGEEAVLHVATAYACMDMKEYDAAMAYVRHALQLDPELGPAHRCLGLLLFRRRSDRKEALHAFNQTMDLCGPIPVQEAGGANEFSLRCCAIVMAMEGDYKKALRTMQLAVQAPNSVSPLGWRALATMTYLYGDGSHKDLITQSLPMLDRAIELSGGIDTEAFIMKGQMLMELNKAGEARAAFMEAMTMTPGDSILLASQALCLAAIGFRAPIRATQADYDAKFQDMTSLGALTEVEDPELLFLAAINPQLSSNMKAKVMARVAGGHGTGHPAASDTPTTGSTSTSSHPNRHVRHHGVDNGTTTTTTTTVDTAGLTMNILGNPGYDPTQANGRRKPSVLSSSSQLRQEPLEVTNARTASGVSASASAAVAAAGNAGNAGNAGYNVGATKVDVAPDVLYWYGMHKLSQPPSRGGGADNARIYFTRAVQRTDCPPQPLALYMLGWLAELQGDLKVAERYYCYSLQLEPIDSLYFLRLQKLAKDTLAFVKGLAKQSEKAEVQRKKTLKKKNKLRRRGVSVPVGSEADETGEQHTALTVMRRRLLLHERVHKLSLMRKEQLGRRLQGLNTPGKCMSLDPFWQERLLHAFSECDNWATMLKASNVYKKF